MSEVALSGAPQPGFTEKQKDLAKRSVRRAKKDALLGGFWVFVIAALYAFTSENSVLRFVAFAAMIAAPVGILLRVFYVNRNPLRHINVPERRVFQARADYAPIVPIIWFAYLAGSWFLQNAWGAALIFGVLFIYALAWWTHVDSSSLELMPEGFRQGSKWRDKKGSHATDVTIAYTAVTRIEADLTSLLIFYLLEETEAVFPLDQKTYGPGALAALLQAIEEHAPQAKFDDEADLMRRGYFSW